MEDVWRMEMGNGMDWIGCERDGSGKREEKGVWREREKSGVNKILLSCCWVRFGLRRYVYWMEICNPNSRVRVRVKIRVRVNVRVIF